MNRPQNKRRGVVIGLSALAGLATAALGVVGLAQHAGVAAAQQQDITLTAIGQGATDPGDYNAADTAHAALVAAQVAQNDSLFDQGVALQQSIYHWADQNDFAWLLFPGDASDPSTNLFNGAFTRFAEAMLVGQAIQQVQWDHLLGVNQTLGAGGYEAQIAESLYGNISGSGVDPDSDLFTSLALLSPANIGDIAENFSDFHGALVDVQSDLWSLGFSDLLGMFSA